MSSGTTTSLEDVQRATSVIRKLESFSAVSLDFAAKYETSQPSSETTDRNLTEMNFPHTIKNWCRGEVVVVTVGGFLL